MPTEKRTRQKLFIFTGLLLLIIGWILLIYFFSPEEIVGYIGVRNGYLVMFLVALLGGVSSFSSASYFAVLITLAAGGLNPFLLGILSGIGVTFGDTLFFYLGRHGRMSLLHGGFATRAVRRLTEWLDGKPTWFTPALIYIYAGFTPLPNDILAIAMGLARRTYFMTIAPLVLGNITLTILASLISGQVAASF